MKNVLKTLAVIVAIGAMIGGIIYLTKKRTLEEDLEDLDDLDDFDDFDDFDDEIVEEDNVERVYTSINLDVEESEEESEEE